MEQALLQGRLDLPSRDGIPAQVLQVPGPVRAHAWIALGKLCLVDEALAKKTLPFFVQELQRYARVRGKARVGWYRATRFVHLDV